MTSLGSEGNKEVEPGLSRSLGKDLVRPNPFLTSWRALGRLLLSPILSLCPSTWCSASPPLAHWWSWTGTSEPMSQNPKTKQPSNQNTKTKQRDHFGCCWFDLFCHSNEKLRNVPYAGMASQSPRRWDLNHRGWNWQRQIPFWRMLVEEENQCGTSRVVRTQEI